MSLTTGPLAIMGGAFDPVHYGHLRTAWELHERLRLAELRFVPSANPPHRPAHHASGAQRLQMLTAAVAGLSWCTVDDRELRRDGPSWSVLTLNELRTKYPGRSLCMILGMDAFLGLPGWHRWEEIIGLANLIVVHRPGWVPPSTGILGDLLATHGAVASDELHQHPAGRILIQEVTQLEISSSAIRELLAAGREPRYLLPDCVSQIINAHDYYAGRSVS